MKTIKIDGIEYNLVQVIKEEVVNTTSNNFKEYGFKANFKGKILADEDNYYFGYYLETYWSIPGEHKIPCSWNKQTGNCYKGGGVSNSKYSLIKYVRR